MILFRFSLVQAARNKSGGTSQESFPEYSVPFHTKKIRTMKNLFAFLCSLSLFSAMAQTHRWTRTNPGGGGAFSTVGAGITGIVVAGSDLSGAYISRNRGESWEVLGASGGLTATHVSGVGFDRKDGNILYIGAEGGIFRSDDGGSTVQQVLEGGYVTDIECAASSPDIGYASFHSMYNTADGSVYKTIDRGMSWHQVSLDLAPGLRILKLLVHPGDANTVFLLSGQGRFACGPAEVYRSTNGGKNWKLLSGAWTEVLDVAISSLPPYTLYLTSMHAGCDEMYYWKDLEGDFFSSDDMGEHWTRRSDYTGIIWLDSGTPDKIRLIDPREPWEWNDRSGTYSSTDGGKSFVHTGSIEDWDSFFQGSLFWTYGSSYNGICKTLGEDLSDPNSIYWVNTQWCMHSSDGGNSFQNAVTREVKPGFWRSTGFDNVVMMDLEVNQADPDIVYIGFFDMGIWRSIDHGESWQACNQKEFVGEWEGFGGNCATIISDPERSNVVWASLGGEQSGEPETFLIKSTQTGLRGSWTASDSGLPREEIIGLSLNPYSPVHNRTLYVTAQRDVYKSTDDGAHWSKVFDCDGCRFTAIDSKDPMLVYAGGERGLWRSEDAGKNWVKIGLSQMKSSNDDGFWGWGYDGIWDVKTDPNHGDRVYVVVHGADKGLWRSTDRGKTWKKLLTDNHLRKVALLPKYPQIIYATSSSAFTSGGYEPDSRGVLYSMDGGAHWVEQNQGMAYPFAQAIAFDSRTPATVFIGSPGTGIQKSQVPYTTGTGSNTEATEVQFSLLPNPARNLIALHSNYKMLSAELRDTKGQNTLYIALNGTSATCDISSLPAGIYFITIRYEMKGITRGISKRIMKN